MKSIASDIDVFRPNHITSEILGDSRQLTSISHHGATPRVATFAGHIQLTPFAHVEAALRRINAAGHLVIDHDKKPLYPASDWQNPDSQLTLEAAVDAWSKYGVDLARGVAIVAGYELLVIDIDPLKPEQIAQADEVPGGLAHIEAARNAIMAGCAVETYTEQTTRGFHYVYRISAGSGFFQRRARRVLKQYYGIDVITGPMYCNISGRSVGYVDSPVDGTNTLSNLFETVERHNPAKVFEGHGGPVGWSGLPDPFVWQVLSCQRPATYALASDDGERSFSDAIMKVVGDLAKITSDAAQVERMLWRCPLVACDRQTNDGATRTAKFQRLFHKYWWPSAQVDNTQGLPIVTHDMIAQGGETWHQLRYLALGDMVRDDEYRRIPYHNSIDGVKRKRTEVAAASETTDYRNDLAHPASLAAGKMFEDIGHAMGYMNTYFYVVIGHGQLEVRTKFDTVAYKKQAFIEAYAHLTVRIKPADNKKADADGFLEVPLVPMWLAKGAERYLKVSYEPVGCNEQSPDYIGQAVRNTWLGFRAKKCDVTSGLASSCPTIFAYLWHVVASEREDVLTYTLKWLADMIQNPRRTAQRTAFILYGENEGTGKSMFGELCASLFDPGHSAVLRFDDLESKFTSTLENKAILICNEFFMPQANMRNIDASAAEKVRNKIFDLIDHPRIMTERKTKDSYEQNNFARLVLSSNKMGLLPKDSKARRMFFVKVSNWAMGNTTFWKALGAVCAREDGEGGELDRFFTLLADIALNGFMPQGDRPMTREMQDQLQTAMSGLTALLYELLDAGELPYIGEPRYWEDNARHYFVQQGDPLKDNGIRGFLGRISGNRLHQSAKVFGIDIMAKMSQYPARQKYELPNSPPLHGRWWPELAAAREWFAEQYNAGVTIDWSNDLSEWTLAKPTMERMN